MEENKSNEVKVDDLSQEHVSMDSIMEQQTVSAEGTVDDGDMVPVHDTSAISKFFAREVQISSYSWAVGATPFFVFNPWSLYLDRTSVRQKLNYFARFRATLVVRLNISATPFHYGMLRFVYRPHPGVTAGEDVVFNMSTPQQATDHTLCHRVVYSQLPRGVYVNPANDTSVELRIPYISQFPGLEVSDSNADRIGELAIIGFTQLRHAQNGTDPVRMMVLAHLEEVTLDVPTQYTLV
jgi:hypothetical protein